MLTEFEPDPSVLTWKGLGTRVVEGFTEEWPACSGCGYCKSEQGPGDPFEVAVDSILAELRETMLRKHRDYGPLNIANAPGGPINGLRVRMHDKLARINNLTDKGSEPENESLQDSFLDIANYGIIGLMVLRGDWPGCEKN